jgi:hypothetical protein
MKLVLFSYSTVEIFIALHWLLCLLVIEFFNPFLSSVGRLGHFSFLYYYNVKTIPLSCKHLLPLYDLVLSVI